MDVIAYRKIPFWTKDTNKPNIKAFEEWKKQNRCSDVYVQNFNWVDKYTIQAVQKDYTTNNLHFTGIDNKYLEIKDAITTNKNYIKYYFLSNIEIKANYAAVLTYTLDIWTSFVLPWMEQNKEVKFTNKRSQNYKNIFLINELYSKDEMFCNLVPLYINDYKLNKTQTHQQYYDGEYRVYYNQTRDFYIHKKTKEDKTLFNKYFVFSNGANGNFKIFPILSDDSSYVEIGYNEKWVEIQNFKYVPSNGGGDCGGPSPHNVELFNNTMSEVYANPSNYKVEWYVTHLDNTNIKEYIPSKYIYDYRVLDKDIRVNYDWYRRDGVVHRIARKGIYFFERESWWSEELTPRWGASDWWRLCNYQNDLNRSAITVIVKKRVIDTSNNVNGWKNIKNRFIDIYTYANRAENIGHLQGVFYGPNILDYSHIIPRFDEDILHFEIPKEGINLSVNIFEGDIRENVENIKEIDYSLNPYTLSLMDYWYYGNTYKFKNHIDIFNGVVGKQEYRLRFDGIMYFSDKFYTFIKSSLNNSNDAVIDYASFLPVTIDEYLKTIKLNRERIDTSYNNLKSSIQIQKEQNKFNTIFNSVTGFVKNGINAVGGLVSGEVGKVGNSVVDMVTGPISQGMNYHYRNRALDQQLINKEKEIRANINYQKNTINSIVPFNIPSIIASVYERGERVYSQGEILRTSDFTPETKLLSNYFIYLNGFYIPENTTLESFLNNTTVRPKYLEIESLIFENSFNFYNDWIDNDIYDLIKEILTQGVRIWGTTHQTINWFNLLNNVETLKLKNKCENGVCGGE